LESQTGRRCVLIAESDNNDPRMTRPRAEHGLGMTAQWNEEFHRSLHTALTPERAGWYADYHGLEDLLCVLRHGFAHRGRYSTFRKRRHGRALSEVPHRRCVAYLQTHDLVGNRPAGERLGQLVEPRAARLAAALLLLGPWVPMLFQGEEWNASSPFLYFTDHGDPGLGRAVLAGRKRDFAGFGWTDTRTPDPQSESTYLRSRLQWSELDDAAHAAFLSSYRRLIELRRSWAELTAPARAELDGNCLQLWREQSIAFFNFSSEVYARSLFELDEPGELGPLEIVLASNVEGEANSGGHAVGTVIESGEIRLGPFAFLLVRRSRP
ncbi:MAG TPA: hypothetical protein VFQ61_37630, partial [Polyangiaceae bacterium]|nr:hypothetical protein [Polyangiaceae bacterium]